MLQNLKPLQLGIFVAIYFQCIPNVYSLFVCCLNNLYCCLGSDIPSRRANINHSWMSLMGLIVFTYLSYLILFVRNGSS